VLGRRLKLADRHILDHAPSQRAYGRIGHEVLLSEWRLPIPHLQTGRRWPQPPGEPQSTKGACIGSAGRARSRRPLPRERFRSLALSCHPRAERFWSRALGACCAISDPKTTFDVVRSG
jgi:hypothetical protein